MPPDLAQSVIGWDIGGAHVKVANMHGDVISNIFQLSCPLWKGLQELSRCIESIQESLDVSHSKHAITMTGELVDHFDSRKQGVACIVDEMNKKLSTDEIYFYAGDMGFLDSSRAVKEYEKVASANWLASSQYVAKKMERALFIDIGSTTTDIVTIENNEVTCEGYTDAQRLVAKELVYCGVVRTPIFAICNNALIKNQNTPVINEYFSNMADIYRITGELPEHADIGDTLDGRSKDIMASARRLARMFAHDVNSSELEIWRAVAMQIRIKQIQMVKDACRHQLMNKSISLDTPVVGAGVGRFLAKTLAAELGREYIDYENLFDNTSVGNNFSISDCAPAAAVACLASIQI